MPNMQQVDPFALTPDERSRYAALFEEAGAKNGILDRMFRQWFYPDSD